MVAINCAAFLSGNNDEDVLGIPFFPKHPFFAWG
jgi:hypothetical protein